MSREEIDRILSEDLTIIDTTISKKLQTMDSITDRLKEKSNFLAQFQLLLEQEINNPKFELLMPSISLDSLAETEMICPKVEEKPQEIIQIKRQQTINEGERDQETVVVGESECLQQSGVNVSLRQKNRKLNECLRVVYNSVCETRQFLYEFLDSLQSHLEQQKREFTHFFEASLHMVIQSLKGASQKQISLLRNENICLKEQLMQLKELEDNRLKQLTFNDLKEREQFDLTQKLRNFYSRGDDQRDDLSKRSINVSSIKAKELTENSIRERNTYVVQKPMYALENYQSKGQKRIPFKPQQNIKLPFIKALTIGVPPVKNGFGVLKSGSVTIYRGIWVNGRFQGKGRLQWDNFSYEGEFKNGLFSGFGKLQMCNIKYMGKFENNKAEGEGTYQKQGRKVSGFWRENQLVKSY